MARFTFCTCMLPLSEGCFMRPCTAILKLTLPELTMSGSKLCASAMLTLPLALRFKAPPFALLSPRTFAVPLARRSVSGPVM